MKNKMGLIDSLGIFSSLLSQVSAVILKRFPTLGVHIKKAYSGVNEVRHINKIIVQTSILSLLFSVLILVLLRLVQGVPVGKALIRSFIIGISVFWLFMILFLALPKIHMVKRGEHIDRHLLFGLREVLLLAKAGYPLQDALLSIARGGYGELSVEMEIFVRNIEANRPIAGAWKDARERSPSLALDRIFDILESAAESGSILDGQLEGYLVVLEAQLNAQIRSYSKELSLWSLLYLLFAVAIPTIGAVLMLVLSTLLSEGMDAVSFLMFVGITFLVQIILIGLVRSRRPLGL